MAGIVFSRDRALQLEGALRSFFLHCRDGEEARLCVLYRTTGALHDEEYARLARDYAGRGVRFVAERRFRADVLKLLAAAARAKGMRSPGDLFRAFTRALGWWASDTDGEAAADGREAGYVMLLVDDNIFVREFRLRQACAALEAHPGALGFSLRLGVNTTYCYSLDRPQEVPAVSRLSGRMLKFDWTTAESDFGYPLEVSSSVYRIGDLAPLLRRLTFENPSTLEGRMARRVGEFSQRMPSLLSYERSVTFCNAVNKVQTVNPNRSGRAAGYSSERLAERFAEGYRIKVEAYMDFVPTACHQEVELILEKREDRR